MIFIKNLLNDLGCKTITDPKFVANRFKNIFLEISFLFNRL